jgi:hypothetical protein
MNLLIKSRANFTRSKYITEFGATFLYNSEISVLPCEGIYIGSSIGAPGVIGRCYLSCYSVLWFPDVG